MPEDTHIFFFPNFFKEPSVHNIFFYKMYSPQAILISFINLAIYYFFHPYVLVDFLANMFTNYWMDFIETWQEEPYYLVEIWITGQILYLLTITYVNTGK